MEEKLGAKYVEQTRVDLAKALEESSPATPMFFILSPGVDALKDLEALGEWPGGLLAHPPTFRPRPTHPSLQFIVTLVSFIFIFSICWRLGVWKMLD